MDFPCLYSEEEWICLVHIAWGAFLDISINYIDCDVSFDPFNIF